MIYLISEKLLKTETVINDNVDTMYLLPAMDTAQNMGLRELIGDKLLNTICSYVEDGTINEKPDYKKFLDDYITPYLKYKVCSEITIPLAYKYRNTGVVQTDNPYEHNNAMKDAQTMKSYYDDRANYFAVQIKKEIQRMGWTYHDTCSGQPGGYATNIVL